MLTQSMIFQDARGLVFLQDSAGRAFSCVSAEFAAYEPQYEAIDADAVRYWSESVQYLNDGNQRRDDFFSMLRFEAFCGRITQYQAAYDAAHIVKPPTIFATLSFSGGDSKTPIGLKLGHATKGVMTISGDLRATPETAGLPVSVSYAWRITIRQVASEFCTQLVGSVPVDGCTVTNNIISWVGFDPQVAGLGVGIYMITDEDFAKIPGAAFGLAADYRVELVGGAKFFKVLKSR